MIDPFAVTALLVACALTIAALVLAKRASDRTRQQQAVEPTTEKMEGRHVNGGWH